MAQFPVVLVLAAGRGERFRAHGGSTHKLQALLHGKAVLAHTLDAVRASGLRWHVQHAQDDNRNGNATDATNATTTMGDSIAAAVAATHNAPGWLVLPADLPLIQPHTLRQMAQAPMRSDIVVPYYQGQRGHPVRFATVCARALAACQGQAGAAHVMQQYTVSTLEVDDIGCVFDIDTPADLERAALHLAAMPHP